MTTLRLRELLGRRKVDVIAALEGCRFPSILTMPF
jgi:hypothetical protein